jgi:ribose-phosphate pyrophosphokinase
MNPAKHKRSMDAKDVRIFSGRSHPSLARGIADYLGVPLAPTEVSRFSNDNLSVQLGASVRGRVVYIVQSLIRPVSDSIMELFMMLDIARGAGAREIHAIIPYYSYARSDKKDAPRISITARLLADLLVTAGATHIMTMSLHSAQVHGFFSVPTDPLTARPLFVRHFEDYHLDPRQTIVVAPDVGRAKSAARFAGLLGLPVAAADKTRISDNEVWIGGSVAKQVQGYQHAVVYDDEIATGSSVAELSRLLIEGGIEKITIVCTHGLFTNGAIERLGAIPNVVEIVTTDTVPHEPDYSFPNLTVLSVAPVFGEAIWRNYNRLSIGDLFTFGEENDEAEKESTDTQPANPIGEQS